MEEVNRVTGLIDWQKFWINHPQKQYVHNKNVLWANLRPANYNYKRTYKEIDKLLHIKPEDQILDVGCGTGELLPLIKATVVGVDASETMAEIARVRHPKIRVIKAYAHCLPFIDESFDKIVSNGVIQHISYDFFEASVNEMLRVLKVGGKLFIGDVLEKADPATQVFVYPEAIWEMFGKVSFSVAGFERRLNVVIEKV